MLLLPWVFQRTLLDYRDFLFLVYGQKYHVDIVFAYAFMNKTSGGQRMEKEFIFSVNSHGNLSGRDPRCDSLNGLKWSNFSGQNPHAGIINQSEEEKHEEIR